MNDRPKSEADVGKLDRRGRDDVDDRPPDDLALVDAVPDASLCTVCDHPQVGSRTTTFGTMPACREHATFDERITADQRQARIDEMIASGAAAGVVAAYFSFAIKRSRR